MVRASSSHRLAPGSVWETDLLASLLPPLHHPQQKLLTLWIPDNGGPSAGALDIRDKVPWGPRATEAHLLARETALWEPSWCEGEGGRGPGRLEGQGDPGKSGGAGALDIKVYASLATKAAVRDGRATLVVCCWLVRQEGCV